jgi:Uma2 family endonuclease
MSVAPNIIPPKLPERSSVPPLENGDRLTRVEFERRYAAMPNVTKAELIEGIVHMPSPVRIKRHGRPHVILTAWLGHYIARTPGLEEFGDNSTVRLDMDNEPQPDLFLNLPRHAGGQATIDEDDYLSGAPTLACEIASSSVSIDLHAKLNVYRRNQVREYLVWRTDDREVDWFAWREGTYEKLPEGAQGIIQSEQFPGLWLNRPALIEGDLPKLFKTIDEGAATPEHARFVDRLRGG